MTETADQILLELEKTIACAAEALSRLRAISARPDAGTAETALNPADDLIRASVAAKKLARCGKTTMNRWCRKYPLGTPGGFAIKLRNRWFVSKSAFERFLRSPAADGTFERKNRPAGNV